MIQQYQIDGLNKLVNSSVIKDIYPMVDRIEISHDGVFSMPDGNYYRLDIDIFLNDLEITKDNMYERGFDPHYLIDIHLKDYLPYFNLHKVMYELIVWGPNGEVVDSFSF